ncbi:MAG: zinc-binding dehydrogenase [Deltaproteobacteria bacterium]|nr:zinc-binding dehydrogenase [Deltaproteobacteria bacterium]MBW2362870.1 zinc-binding dehydrogenase [Deltaproteobacteria bacterium]
MSDSGTSEKRMRAWRVHEYGDRPTETLRLDTVEVPIPEAGELLVRVQAIPLNLNDLERINGRNMMVRPELPSSPGMEVMGVVERGGAGVESWEGRRVVAMPKQAYGGFAEFANCPVVSAFEMPASIPLPDAAALYFPFHLAWLGLIDRAELREGETVLIHAAAGGVGSAAVQLAVHRGARVIATVGSDAKAQLCRDLGADVVINYATEDFLPIVLEQTGNRGVDVVFDNVGEAVMEKSIKAIAYNGRYVMNGFASDKSYADEKFIVPRSISAGNFKLCGVLLAYADATTGPVFKQAMGWNFVPNALGKSINEGIVALVLERKIKPVIGRVVAFEELPAAMQAMANRETVGRTIVQLT